MDRVPKNGAFPNGPALIFIHIEVVIPQKASHLQGLLCSFTKLMIIIQTDVEEVHQAVMQPAQLRYGELTGCGWLADALWLGMDAIECE